MAGAGELSSFSSHAFSLSSKLVDVDIQASLRLVGSEPPSFRSPTKSRVREARGLHSVYEGARGDAVILCGLRSACQRLTHTTRAVSK